MKFEAADIVIIGVYRSNEGNCRDIGEKLDAMAVEDKFCVIGGDININLLKSPNNLITAKLKEKGFEQIVKKATHIEGGLIDHVYIRQGKKNKIGEQEKRENRFSPYCASYNHVSYVQ